MIGANARRGMVTDLAQVMGRHGSTGAPTGDGEIKDAPPEGAKRLTWLGPLRGHRSARVPLAREGFGFSNLFPALPIQRHPEGRTHEEPR